MTAQVPENLLLDGEQVNMTCTPGLPKDDPRIVATSDAERQGQHMILRSTACWRRYRGTWEIKDDKLYLNHLIGDLTLAEGQGPIFADWYSGWLIVPDGDMIEYVHIGFGSVFEREIRIRVENGVVVERKTIEAKPKDHQ